MDFTDYQRQAHTTAEYVKTVAELAAPIYRVLHKAGDTEAIAALEEMRYKLLLAYAALGLTGEAGEVANKIKKVLRGDGNQLAYGDELGDVLWYLSESATLAGWSFEVLAERNLDKLADRQNRGVIKGQGDKR